MMSIDDGDDDDDDDEKDPLRRPEQMKKQLAELKHLMRKSARHAVSEEDDWHFQTCLKRATRLRVVAVEGRIPAIRGMPVVEEEDAEMIEKAILAIRGADKKKHEKALHEGTLKLPLKRLPMSGAVQAWRKACGRGQIWNASHIEKEIAYKPLKVVRCPECQEEHQGLEAQIEVRIQQSQAPGMPGGDDRSLLEMPMLSEVDKVRNPQTRRLGEKN